MTKEKYIMVYMPNEETGQEEEKYVSLDLLFDRMWNEYVRGMIPDEMMRGMLMELGMRNVDVVRLMLRLKTGKVEFEETDYRERSYR